jgi:hypothetical protein
MTTACVSVSGGLSGDMHKYMLKKLLIVAKKSKNIQPGNAELKRKEVTCANGQIYSASPQG